MDNTKQFKIYKTIQDLMLIFTPKTPNAVMLVNAATRIEEKDNSKQYQFVQ
nr:hypothetical protein [Orientia tsutsugamushi]